jgi:hypothetical protein
MSPDFFLSSDIKSKLMLLALPEFGLRTTTDLVFSLSDVESPANTDTFLLFVTVFSSIFSSLATCLTIYAYFAKLFCIYII